MKKTTIFLIALLGASVFATPAVARTFRVYMVKKGQGKWVFRPARLTIRRGDRVQFIQRSKMPHTVTFYDNKVPGKTTAARKKLAERLSSSSDKRLRKGWVFKWNAKFTAHFKNAPLGLYYYYCLPHEALGIERYDPGTSLAEIHRLSRKPNRRTN